MQSQNTAYLEADLKDQLSVLRETHAIIRKELRYEGTQDWSWKAKNDILEFPTVAADFATVDAPMQETSASLNEGFNYFRHLQELFRENEM